MKRAPDFIIGSPDDPYLRRWWIVPRNRWFNIYLHQILKSDDDRALHDHPWWNVSFILLGGYIEHTPRGKHNRKVGSVVFRKATAAHRLEIKTTPAWTLFITGPRIRQWGFHCPKGWVHWRDFVGVKEGEALGDEVGKGCGD